jgi:hypothetical protein
MTSAPVPSGKHELLITTADLGRRLNVGSEMTRKLLKQWKIKPVQSMPYGRGAMHFYSDMALRPHLDKWFAAHPPKVAVQPVTVSSGTDAKVMVLNGMVEDLSTQLKDARDTIVANTTHQNRALLDILLKHGELLAKLVKELGVKE